MDYNMLPIEVFINSPLVSFGMGVCLLVVAIQVFVETDFKKIYIFKLTSFGSMTIILLWILFFLGITFLKGNLGELTVQSELRRMVWVIFLSVLGALCYKRGVFTKTINNIYTYLIDNKGLLVGLVVISIAVVLRLDTSPMYDSNLYYGQIVKGINSFDYSLQGFFTSFMVWGKLFHPLAPLLVLGEIISAGTARGLYIINLMLLLGAVVCVYEIIKQDFVQLSKNQCALLGMLFAFFSYVLVGTIYINPDFYCAIFFVYFVYFYKINDKLMFLYTATVFVCCKKNMLVSYGIFLLLVTIGKYKKKSIRLFLKEEPLLFYLLPIELMVFLLGASVKTTDTMPLGFNTFWEKTVNRLLQCFVFNFKWLVLISFMISIGILIGKFGLFKVIKTALENYMFEVSIIIASFSQLIIYLVFWKKLSIAGRYFAQNALAFIMLITFVVVATKRIRAKWCSAVAAGFVLLFLMENYYTIDPMLSLFAVPIEFVRGNIYIECCEYKKEPIGIGDMASYNFGYSLWDGIFQNIFKENISDFSDEVYFFSALDKDHLLGCDAYRYGLTFIGKYDVFWDEQKECISYISSGNKKHKIFIDAISADNFEQHKEKLLSRSEIVLLEPDGMDSTICNRIIDLGYEIVYEKVYTNSKTQMKYVKLNRK